MQEVVLGFVGSGRMGQIAHIANYAAIPGVRMRGIFDIKPEQAALVAAKYGIERVYSSLDELAADPDISAVVCTLPSHQNRNVAVPLLAAGKHVVTEKPLAGCPEDAEAIVAAAKLAGRHATVGYMKCFDAGVEYARNVIANWGAPPELVHLHFGGGDWVCNAGLSVRTQEETKGLERGRMVPADLPADAHDFYRFCANQHVHHLGLLRFLLSEELELDSLARKGRSHSALFTAGNNTLVSMEHSPLKAEWWEEYVKLFWPDGYVVVETPPPLLRNVPARVRVYRHHDVGGDFSEPSLPASWAFQRAAEHFVRVVQGEEAPRVPAEYGLRDVKHCEVMARAARWV